MRNKQTPKEFLERIKKNSKYSLDEVNYKPIIEDNDDFDDLPSDVISSNYMTQDGYPSPNSAGSSIVGEADDDVIDPNADPNANPGGENNGEAPLPAGENPELNPGGEQPAAPPEENPEDNAADREFGGDENPEPEPPEEPKEDVGKEVDELQNEIIKNNIAAMESMVNKLDSLDQYINQVTQQLDALNKKVKEVEEPTNTEKMLQRKDVSYPFYFNLNDYWKDNFFDQRRNELNEKGVKELPDGTYIADFDDLPPSENNYDDDSIV